MNQHQANKKTAITMLMIVAGMFMLAYAAFPLYNLFCRITGYGGTTQVSEVASAQQGTQEFTIRFNADKEAKLPWGFMPLQKKVQVLSGDNTLVFYKAVNHSDKPVTGVATYNVTPERAGLYFQKVQCFCFERQTLKAGEDIEMPISFFIDPAIEQDPEMDGVKTITLSYTFFVAKD